MKKNCGTSSLFCRAPAHHYQIFFIVIDIAENFFDKYYPREYSIYARLGHC